MQTAFLCNCICGLKIKPNATNPEYKIDIETGYCRDDDDSCNMKSDSTITIDITVSGANGLDTGSEAAATWYYVWLIYKQSTDTVSGLFSLSSTSPTMPAGYIAKRRIGSVYNKSISLLNPYAHWKLNESSGVNVADSSGNGRNGTTVNMEDIDWVAGKLNNCLQFDGVNEYVNCSSIANFERTDLFSLECWFKASVKGTLLSRRDNTGAPYRGWQITFDASGYPTFILCNTYGSNAITVRVETDYVDNAWHHIIVTYDGSSTAAGVKFYIDGVSKTTAVIQNNLSATIQVSKNCQIGAVDGAGNCITGLIDEVAIYNYVLSFTQVTFRWNSGSGTESMQESAEDFKNFYCLGNNNVRKYIYREPRGISMVLSAGTATIFTDVDLSSAVPVTSEVAELYCKTNAAKESFVRPDGFEYIYPSISLPAISSFVLISDCNAPGQKVEYQVESGGSLDIDVLGYCEEL